MQKHIEGPYQVWRLEVGSLKEVVSNLCQVWMQFQDLEECQYLVLVS